MGKHGMKERVTKNPDPTFSEVLGIFREEAREIKEKQKAADAFACISQGAGYARAKQESGYTKILRCNYKGHVRKHHGPQK